MFIPVRVYVPTDERPFVNVSLIVITCAISIVALVGETSLFERLAGVDMEAVKEDRIVLSQDSLPRAILSVTSALLHGGWLHLAGNMLFLWVFGNAVEYKFRHIGYASLYIASAVAAGLLHYAMDGSPFVGASGAINGIMGAFIVFFPRNDVQVLLFVRLMPTSFTMSSIWLVLFYVAWDVTFILLGAGGSVALWAHVGGLLAGFVIAFVAAYVGWLRPEEDEQTLLQVLRIRANYERARGNQYR